MNAPTALAYDLLRARWRRHAVAAAIATGHIAKGRAGDALRQWLRQAGMAEEQIAECDTDDLLERLKADASTEIKPKC